MKIYIVIHKDRHIDTKVYPFLNLYKAINWVNEEAVKICKNKNYLKAKDIGEWHYYLEYSNEGDCFWITEHDL